MKNLHKLLFSGEPYLTLMKIGVCYSYLQPMKSLFYPVTGESRYSIPYSTSIYIM